MTSSVVERESVPELWDLPDAVLFHIVSYVAGPTRRAAILCHGLACLCKKAKFQMLDESRSNPIWDMVLKEDYKVASSFNEDAGTNTRGREGVSRRRTCQRLRKSVMQQVQSSHLLIKDHTEIAYFYLSELCSGPAGSLTRAKMVQILNNYGPHLRINEVVSSGGVFLVEVCRARNTTEANILRCIKELMEHYGATPDPLTNEANNCRHTALCVAAARGMPKIVAYLLERGASTRLLSSGRFRLHTRSGKSLRRNQVTPLEFSQAMRQAEAEAGATKSELRTLDQCIQLLQQKEKELSARAAPIERKRKPTDNDTEGLQCRNLETTLPKQSISLKRQRQHGQHRIAGSSGMMTVRIRSSVALPCGQLGLKLCSSDKQKGTFIGGIQKQALLFQSLNLGDQIIQIDNRDVSALSVLDTSAILEENKMSCTRTIVVVSEPILAELPIE